MKNINYFWAKLVNKSNNSGLNNVVFNNKVEICRSIHFSMRKIIQQFNMLIISGLKDAQERLVLKFKLVT